MVLIDEDDSVPISEPCKESASKDRCLCTSMKAGMRSPGLYWMGLVSLVLWLVEQPRDKEREGVVVRVDDMIRIWGIAYRRVIDDSIRER